MKQNVTFIDLAVSDNTLPLVAGYLQAYACQDQAIVKAYAFEHYTASIRTPVETIIKDLLADNGDIYAFSCYTWNMGLVRRALPILLEHKPKAQFILGGPQVMHQAHKYLNAERENLVLCNGEGEKSFYQYLAALTETRPDLAQVGGLSFYRDQTLVTTPSIERISHLDEIPSPFLNNIFTRHYNVSVFETTRGCPFHCAFCYWGAATNDRVYKFSEERLREEIDWFGRNGVYDLLLADANWGMLKRDFEISRHIVTTSQKYGTPAFVTYATAKNQPKKVMEIVEMFHKAGIVTGQVISMQTLSETSLAQIDRENIKLSTYMEVQEQLHEKGLGSFVELIWPLPGETLTSFQAGINTLCATKISTIIVYPHMLLANTPLYHRREELGLVTRKIDEGIGEQENIIQTNEVDYPTFQAGVRFYFAAYILYNMRTLLTTAAYLSKYAGIAHHTLFAAFVDFLLQRQDSPLGRYFRETAEDDNYYPWMGKIIHYTLHEHRAHFGELLAEFVTTQPWWRDKQARLLFEIDLLRQPYFYNNTPFTPVSYPFEQIRLMDTTANGYVVQLAPETLPLLVEFVLPAAEAAKFVGQPVKIEHPTKGKMIFDPSHGIENNTDRFFIWLMRIDDFFPQWTLWTEPRGVIEEERIFGEI